MPRSQVVKFFKSIDGEYYCQHCGKDQDSCKCPEEEEREAIESEEWEHRRKISEGE